MEDTNYDSQTFRITQNATHISLAFQVVAAADDDCPASAHCDAMSGFMVFITPNSTSSEAYVAADWATATYQVIGSDRPLPSLTTYVGISPALTSVTLAVANADQSPIVPPNAALILNLTAAKVNTSIGVDLVIQRASMPSLVYFLGSPAAGRAAFFAANSFFTAPPLYNPVILHDPYLPGTDSGTGRKLLAIQRRLRQSSSSANPQLSLSATCFKVDLVTSISSLVSNATELRLRVVNYVGSSECRAVQASLYLAAPLYLRVVLSPQAAVSLTNQGTVTPSATAVVAQALPSPPNVTPRGAVTWTSLPGFGRSFVYVINFPGNELKISDMCSQGEAGQPVNSCIVHIIASNGTAWSGGVLSGSSPPPSPFPSTPGDRPSPSPSGLTENERIAIIVCATVGGLILLGIAASVAVLVRKQKQAKWAPAKDEGFDGVGPEENAAMDAAPTAPQSPASIAANPS